MAESTILTDAIEDGAPKALISEIDGQKLQRRSLNELVNADRYLAGKNAANSTNGGIRFLRAFGANGGGR